MSNKIFFATILTPVVLIYTTTFIGEICLVRQQNTPEDRDDANVSAGPEIRAAHVVVSTIFREGVRATLTRKLRRRGEGEIHRADVLFSPPGTSHLDTVSTTSR